MAAVGAATAGLWLAGYTVPASAAGTGYVPPPPPPPKTPALGTVVCAEPVGPGGGTVTAVINGATVTITVPPGTFSTPRTFGFHHGRKHGFSRLLAFEEQQPIEVVCSTGVDSTIGLPGAPELFFAVQIDQDGVTLPGPFHHAIDVTVSDSAIKGGSRVFRWTGTRYVPAAGWFTVPGAASGSFRTDPGYAIAKGHKHHHVAKHLLAFHHKH